MQTRKKSSKNDFKIGEIQNYSKIVLTIISSTSSSKADLREASDMLAHDGFPELR